MSLRNPLMRAFAAFAAVVLAGGWLWFDWDARTDGFAGYLDRRAAHEAGILSGAEWRAMRAAGDLSAASAGGEGCASDACLEARAAMEGRWAGISTCADGDRYRFADGFVEVTSHKDGLAVETLRRRYRVVSASVTLRLLRGPEGRSLERSVVKQPGDIEVFTLGRSSYVRRIFRAADADTMRLMLVEQRVGRSGPASGMIVEGRRPGAEGEETVYRRCPGS